MKLANLIECRKKSAVLRHRPIITRKKKKPNTFTLTGKISRGSSFRPAAVGGKTLLISVMSRLHPWSLTAGKEHIVILSQAKS